VEQFKTQLGDEVQQKVEKLKSEGWNNAFDK
jgi:hypothetical protein